MSDETNLKKSAVGSGLPDATADVAVKSSSGTWIVWVIWILFLLVVGFNVLALVCYSEEKGLVAYFDSKSYEALLATLLIPLLLSLIARAFKIDEKIQAEQERRDKNEKETRRQRSQEKRKKQIETIEKTNAMWSELYGLSTEVAYFKAGQSKLAVREIRKKLECFTNAAEEVVNLWYLHFDNIPPEVQNLFLPGVNLLLLTAMTVADVVESEEPEDKAEAKHLQNCLLVIQDGVRGGLHYSMMQIFIFAMEDRQADLTKQIANLRGWGEFFKNLLKDLPPNLPPGVEADAIIKKRNAFRPVLEQYSKAKTSWDSFEEKSAAAPEAARRKQIQDSAEYTAARTAYNDAVNAYNPVWQEYKETILKSPAAGLGLSRKRFFPNDQIKKFTAEMFFQNDYLKMADEI